MDEEVEVARGSEAQGGQFYCLMLHNGCTRYCVSFYLRTSGDEVDVVLPEDW